LKEVEGLLWLRGDKFF